MVLLIYNQGNDDTYEVPGRYSEVAMVALADVKRLVTYIAWLWHYIAPCQGNFLPLPGTKRYVGSFFYKSTTLLFTLHSSPNRLKPQ